MTATVEKEPKATPKPTLPSEAKEVVKEAPKKPEKVMIDASPDRPVEDVMDDFLNWLGASSSRARFLALNPQGGRPFPHQAIPGLSPVHQRIVEMKVVIPLR